MFIKEQIEVKKIITDLKTKEKTYLSAFIFKASYLIINGKEQFYIIHLSPFMVI